MYGTCVIMGQSNDYKLYVVTWSLIMHVCEASSNNFKGGQAGTHACMMHGTLFTCLCLAVVHSVRTIIIQLGQRRQYTQRRNQKIFEGGAKRLSQHMAMAAAGGVTATYVRLQFG